MTRTPVTTLTDLATLDDAEMVEGYRDGYAGEPEPRRHPRRHGPAVHGMAGSRCTGRGPPSIRAPVGAFKLAPDAMPGMLRAGW